MAKHFRIFQLMKFERKNTSQKILIDLYKQLLTSRLVEEKMLIFLRQGKISKWFSGIGQEAISVGSTLAADSDTYLLTAHRNLGVFTSRGVPLDRLIAQFQGKNEGFTKGRDRSFHFGSKQHHIVGMISHLAAQLPVACGIALGNKLNKEIKPAIAYLGEGATSEGDFHEALNLASTWDLPVLFIVENNEYSISTHVSEQFNINSFEEKAGAYGIEAHKIDGNNVIEVYNSVKKALNSIKKKSRPILIEAKTFRIRGHEESAANDFVPQEWIDEWIEKDPIENYEQFLVTENILNAQEIQSIYQEIEDYITDATSKASNYKLVEFNEESELQDVYKSHHPTSTFPDFTKKKSLRFIDALNETLDKNMSQYDNLVLMGQDIAEFGGVFKVTQGLVEKHGKERVRNTPLCESAVIGASLGLSIANYKSVVEMQFSDFVTCGFNQIVNNLAKSHYRWGQHADVVIRMPTGGGTGAGPFHSQSTEAWFHRVPGLKIVYPSTVLAAKGLLNSSIQDPNPVLFFEHKKLYRSLEEEIPTNDYTIEIGKARIHKQGEDLSVITYGMGVHWAQEYQDEHPDISIEIIDLQSLLPWDKELVIDSVSKTGKALVFSEDMAQGSICNEIANTIQKHCFESLDAPVFSLGSLPTPIPFSKNLEKGYLPSDRLRETINELYRY